MENKRWKIYNYLEGQMGRKHPLKDKYLRLYSISTCKDARLHDAGSWKNNNWKWTLEWRRRRFEWQSDQINILMQELDNITFYEEGEDKWLWKEDEARVYIVKSAYNILPNDTIVEEKESIWKLLEDKSSPLNTGSSMESDKKKLSVGLYVDFHIRGIGKQMNNIIMFKNATSMVMDYM